MKNTKKEADSKNTNKNYGYVKNRFEQKCRDFNSTFVLIAKSWIKDPSGIISLFVIPTFYFVIFYFLLRNKYSQSLIGYLMLPPLTVITTLGTGLINWKNSVFLKRIDTTGISKTTFLLSLWTFNLLVGLLGVCVQIIVGLIIAQGDAVDQYNSMNWGWFILGTIFISLMSIGLATLIAGIFSSQSMVQGVTMIIYFLSLFLSGIMIPYTTIGSVKALRIISYFTPYMYGNAVTSKSIESAWQMFDGPTYQVFTEIWQPCVASAGIIVALFAITTMTFKWSSND
ncbi:ABC transporter permease [Mesoplasma lactucae]|nr:ABC transporter permease [Mesoplasma lactucae]ATZ20468.1 ABC transporter ATP-binding protein [Mesoplasma lactucae ATCC 49193]MCL8216640.1 hypothetical protein [Mesoplasma lactucae ATCC 49193]